MLRSFIRLTADLFLAAVLVLVSVLVGVAVLVAVLVLIGVTVLVVILILVAVLVGIAVLIGVTVFVIHNNYLLNSVRGKPLYLAYPRSQDLSFGLNSKEIIKPAKIAVQIPPAQAFSPPVKIPKNPCSFTASLTPFANV